MKTMSKSAKKFFAAAACMSMLLVCFAGCNQLNGGGATEQQNPNNPSNPQKSSEKQLLEFMFEQVNNAGFEKDIKGFVYEKNHSITVEVPSGTDKTKLKASFKISDKAKLFIGTAEQKSGETVNDFSNITDGVKLTVKAEDGTTQEYTVKVYIEIKIPAFGFKRADNTPALSSDVQALIGRTIKGNVIIMKLPAGTQTDSLKKLKPYFTTSKNVELSVNTTKLVSGTTEVDFSDLQKGVNITATAEDGGSVIYNAVVEIALPLASESEVSKYFGSYYVEANTQAFGKAKIVIVLEKDKVSLYTDANGMSMDYINVGWEKDGDKYHCTTYKTDYKVTPPKKMPHIKNLYGKLGFTFSEEGGVITTKVAIMGAPVEAKKGNAFVWKEGCGYSNIAMHL